MSVPPTQSIDWEGRYRDGATGWERPGPHPALQSWLEAGVLSPCRILVPGAGRSPEPLVLAEAGFDVTVIDAAETPIAVQRARLERLHVNARVEKADLFLWNPPTPFDVVYDQTCLCGLPPALWPDYTTRLHRWLRPGGRLFILFMQTGSRGGPPFHCDMGEMHRLFPDTLWDWGDKLPPMVDHPSGRSEQPAVLQARAG